MKFNIFTLDNQQKFATLSGDFNPVHLDNIFARRTMFGEVIVHGLNIVLTSIDNWLEEFNRSIMFSEINISFPKPVKLEKPTAISWNYNSEESVTIWVKQNNQTCSKIVLKYVVIDTVLRPSQISEESTLDHFFLKEEPNNSSIDDVFGQSGKIRVAANYALIYQLYPNVKSLCKMCQICSLITTTRLVGMNCPGLNSLFSGLKLAFSKNSTTDKFLNFEVMKVDNRFSLVNIKIENDTVSGVLNTFIRPSAVGQISSLSLVADIDKNTFSGQKALIIGGSRGLGEVFSKVLAAGGAEVILTYYKGQEDADKIVDDIRANGGFASTLKFNVLEDDISTLLGSSHGITHCYYMATPFIFAGNKNVYSSDLFEVFNSYYVTKFYNVVESLFSDGVLNYFYPSSTALDSLENNMIEYTLSKLAGEKLCEFLSHKYTTINIYNFRFPRIETDQTVSIMPVFNENPLELSVKLLREFNNLNKD